MIALSGTAGQYFLVLRQSLDTSCKVNMSANRIAAGSICSNLNRRSLAAVQLDNCPLAATKHMTVIHVC